MNVIIYTDGDNKEAWTTLKGLCKKHNMKHNTLYRKVFPFFYKGRNFEKFTVKK